MSDPAALLPDGLAAAVETASGARIAAVRPRGGGGASREGAELDLAWSDGRAASAYMNYDVHRAGAGDDAAFLREAAILRALSGPLAGAGVRVAPYYASVPEQRALVCGLVAGRDRFAAIADPAQRDALAQDFMAQLAALHRIDVAASPVEGMGPVEPAEAYIRRRVASLRAANGGQAWDPLIHLSLDWLEANVPTDMPAPVIVHGDAGPGNFLYEGNRVTALLDWELVHYGDPMADLAMLCLRMLFQGFVPLPQAFAAYEAAGGHRVDLARLRYWRLLFQTGFARRSRYDDPDAPPPPNLGMNLVYSTIHRRVLSEALAEAAGVALPAVALPDAAPGAHERSFAIALDDIRDTIVPRLADQQAAVKAKGLARLVKWWRAIERYQPGFHEAEKAEIEGALRRRFADHAAAWAAYREAVAAGRIGTAPAIILCNAHEAREATLMADAMGSLAATKFAPLE
ncbi:phosphotransferase family protein [Sphingopyxis panaciterrulae]|uniref:Aminoglycoside phosphotransferase n=1 Tax=Sphingopyxis panaciterrulae TaxID=462372 RepID=A0A7W9B5Q1_9SPHN|nr:phosphotransferase family protein [Sphingopyxis panaciterrulae]MBB5706750.1 aminoglycoside phosphotransferase [Sphingopyxis panaciterrulae]